MAKLRQAVAVLYPPHYNGDKTSSYPLCCCIGEVVVKTPRKPLNTDTDIIISLHSLDFSGDMLYLCLNNLLKNIFNTH